MILDPDPAALVGEAAAARVAELQQTLQRFRREHEAALGALPPVSEDPVAHAEPYLVNDIACAVAPASEVRRS